MKSVRVLLSLLALLALPVVAASAQGNSDMAQCSPDQARQAARLRATGGHVPPGLAKKCPAPPPAQEPPTGSNEAHGFVYQDDDGNGSRDWFAGEMGLAGWTVQLNWNGRTIASTTTDADGNFVFAGLGSAAYSVCVVEQGGFAKTQPSGSCYSFEFTGTIATWFDAGFFGMTPQ
jgi:SdrD B-like domain